MQLPPPFVSRIETVFGVPGRRWLTALPALLETLSRRWDVVLGPPFAMLSYNYAAPGQLRDGRPVVVKVGLPRPELRTEVAALRHFDGRGTVRLLDAENTSGALLLERLLPGAMLADLDDDDEATHIAGQLLRRLWAPPPPVHDFPAVDDWFHAFVRHRAAHEGGSGPLPDVLLRRAEAVYAELRQEDAPALLLHGDFHHYNVLASARAPWLAIDPKGVIGAAGFDTGAFLANPFTRVIGRRQMARRLAVLAETTALPRRRLARWGVAHAMLAACWSVEDGEDPAWGIRVAETLVASL